MTIRVAIAGIGNCASALIQGIEFYKGEKEIIGLMNYDVGGYKPDDIRVVAAFDIDKRKVGKDVSEAIFSNPNCTTRFCKVAYIGTKVRMGKILDGFSEHMKDHEDDKTFILSDENEPSKEEVIDILQNSETEIFLNFLPVGSEEAVKFYAECCLDSGIAFINCMPVFIVSDKKWSKKFKEKNIPIIGDDVKSQIGATITHRVLTNLFKQRGVKLERTYQLNTGGNTDFLNMLNRKRLNSKKISKTEAVQSVLDQFLHPDNIHIGPSDYVPWQKDNKIAFIRMEGKLFGNIPMNLELRLSVEDSPNSAGVVIDAIRCCKLALDRNVGGVLYSPSAYFMKKPPFQMNDEEARKKVEMFIHGKIER
jgi:myo-inositol-1-phosphate synthase